MESIKEFFVEHPEVKILIWSQDTPSFNDGDPCVNGMNDVIFVTEEQLEAYKADHDDADLEDYHEAEDYGTSYYYYHPKEDAPYGEMASALRDNEDVWELVFGTNTQILMTPEGITVSEFYCGY